MQEASGRTFLWLVPAFVGAALLYSSGRRKKSGPLGGLAKASGKLDRHYGADGNRDVVEEASWESFPASDAPAW